MTGFSTFYETIKVGAVEGTKLSDRGFPMNNVDAR